MYMYMYIYIYICSKVRLGLNFEIDEDTKDKIIRKGYEDTIREHELVNGHVR